MKNKPITWIRSLELGWGFYQGVSSAGGWRFFGHEGPVELLRIMKLDEKFY